MCKQASFNDDLSNKPPGFAALCIFADWVQTSEQTLHCTWSWLHPPFSTHFSKLWISVRNNTGKCLCFIFDWCSKMLPWLFLMCIPSCCNYMPKGEPNSKLISTMKKAKRAKHKKVNINVQYFAIKHSKFLTSINTIFLELEYHRLINFNLVLSPVFHYVFYSNPQFLKMLRNSAALEDKKCLFYSNSCWIFGSHTLFLILHRTVVENGE